MDQEIMQKVMDEVMKRIGGGSVISPEKASDQRKFLPLACKTWSVSPNMLVFPRETPLD